MRTPADAPMVQRYYPLTPDEARRFIALAKRNNRSAAQESRLAVLRHLEREEKKVAR